MQVLKKHSYFKIKKKLRESLFQKLKTTSPDSCFVEMMQGQSQKPKQDPIESIPPSISQSLNKFIINNEISQEENVHNFTKSLHLSKNDIQKLEKITINQAQSDEWHEQRQYRLTASNCGRICKRMESIKKNIEESPQNLIKFIINKKSVNNFATRHGIACEPRAKVAVVQVLKNQGHNCLKSSDSGTIIDKNYPFLSASPDLIIDCKCCGKGLVEIKCPYTIRDVAPTAENLEQIDKKHHY